MYFKVGAAMRHSDHAPVRPQVSQLLRAFERGGSPVRGNFHTGLSKRNCAKFRELSHNFPKLVDCAVHWEVNLPVRISKQGTFILHNPVSVFYQIEHLPIIISISTKSTNKT